jgi:hypothetical protein
MHRRPHPRHRRVGARPPDRAARPDSGNASFAACDPDPPRKQTLPLAPLPALSAPQNEANSLCFHYSTLLATDFAGGVLPAIGGPFAGAPAYRAFAHALMSLNVLINALQAPPPAYVTLGALPSGSYICNVQSTWAGGVFCVAVFKP